MCSVYKYAKVFISMDKIKSYQKLFLNTTAPCWLRAHFSVPYFSPKNLKIRPNEKPKEETAIAK